MTLHLFSSIRHAMCRSGRGLCLAPRVFAVFRQLFLLGVLALSAVPAFADGVPSEPQDGLTAIKNALVPPQPSAEQPAPPPPPRWVFETLPPWEKLEEGLQLGLFSAQFDGGDPFEVVFLRIDPAYFDFTVETASSEKQSLPLEAWATRKGLIAAINASMYLPDGVTSTGYLRTGETVSNGRVVSKFGAFFVAGPDSPDLPGADLLDRSTDDWENLLPHYSMVVQNYRMISSDRRLLWKPGGPKHSISAVGRDGTGAILFILCREPITGGDVYRGRKFGRPLFAHSRPQPDLAGAFLAGVLGFRKPGGSAAQRHRCPAQIVMCLPSCGKAAFSAPYRQQRVLNARRA